MASFVAQEVNVPIANGKVCFTVKDWVEGQSSKGDPMITVTCDCVDGDGVTKAIKDYFLLTEKHIFALGIFSKSIGIYDKYLTGSLSHADVVGKQGQCVVGREPNTAPGAAQDAKVVKIQNYLER